MQVHAGDEIRFKYTDAQGVTEDWEGKVTKAGEGAVWFRMATGDAFPRNFRYQRIVGEIEFLVHA